MPYLYATTAYLYTARIAPPGVVALLGLLIGKLTGKLIGTGAIASVSGCIAPGGGVIPPLVGVLNTYSSNSAGTPGGAIIAVPGVSITAVFGGGNKSAPGDSYSMIFRSVASVIYAMVNFCWVVDGSFGSSAAFLLSCKGAIPYLTDLLFSSFVFYVPNMINVATIKVLGLVLPGITRS